MARNGEKRATVHDLARAAGVSLATVDRVLNRRPGVRPATISKVEAAIVALNYQRDASASLLARARDISVAVLLPDDIGAVLPMPAADVMLAFLDRLAATS